MDKRLERILPRVQKPARYVGGEYNAVMKDLSQVDTRVAFCFPDTYEIGMSNLGMRILYGIMNNMEGVWCERVFAPWGDMEEEMRRAGLPLYALESGDPIRDFDIIAFSVGYEMAFPAMLNMLDLAGVPLHASERTELTPLVIAGGTAMFNCEPIADFIDLAVLGEGEEMNVELIELHRRARREGWTKPQFLRAAAQLDGIYVPGLYEVDYNADGTVKSITPKDGAPKVVTKRIMRDMDKAWYPAKTIVPSTEIVQDRVSLELFRGCIRGCRFCQAGMVYRPVREKNIERLKALATQMIEATGYEEISLSSLSSSDYSSLEELVNFLIDECRERRVNISLPSLRIDAFSLDVMSKVQDIKKSSLTFAPEAGSQRLRDVINKGLTEEVILNGAQMAFEGGWNKVKFYFMLGLPTETEADMRAIAELANETAARYYDTVPKEKRNGRCQITISPSFFVPKPFTPFQWARMYPPEDYIGRAKVVNDTVKEQLNKKSIKYNWHEADVTVLEGVLARGDRKIGQAILKVYEKGGIFDAWSEYFDYQRWLDAFAECGIDPDFYTMRERSMDEIFPWDFIDTGVTKEFLKREWNNAMKETVTPNCRMRCSGCGVKKFGGGVCYEN